LGAVNARSTSCRLVCSPTTLACSHDLIRWRLTHSSTRTTWFIYHPLYKAVYKAPYSPTPLRLDRDLRHPCIITVIFPRPFISTIRHRLLDILMYFLCIVGFLIEYEHKCQGIEEVHPNSISSSYRLSTLCLVEAQLPRAPNLGEIDCPNIRGTCGEPGRSSIPGRHSCLEPLHETHRGNIPPA